ncbi:hypothetical protein [Aliarcobacter butzleri]|uniref:hypothetical protein n=1 Tax=Aliarcobacter butzleri TaxID=28197 RepID=UPI00263CCA10|nr:hypothetical protein [Aliarcobacter butzleri]MDN5048597.1 hypothetical protein [Aliarcobacter butzleri]MDN5056699.1 hypothetical protein [Aliarcobacter butzleri]
MKRLNEFKHEVSTLPKNLNRELVDGCKAKFFEKNRALVSVFKAINNCWFNPIIGA